MRAAIFDFDGVLVDSEPLHFGSLREALLPEGIAIDEAEYVRHYLAYDDRGSIRLALETHGMPCDRARVEAILSAGGLRDAFAAIVGADDVAHSKPDPEPYLEALARLRPCAPGLAPAECLVFEDSLPGIASARAAGMKVVAVTNSYPAAKLSAAHLVVPSLEGLAAAGLRDLFRS